MNVANQLYYEGWMRIKYISSKDTHMLPYRIIKSIDVSV